MKMRGGMEGLRARVEVSSGLNEENQTFYIFFFVCLSVLLLSKVTN